MAKPKIKLGTAPKNFKKSVDIVLLSGVAAALEISYIYRTRSQFATLIDEKIASGIETEAAAAEQPVEPQRKTLSDWYQETDEANAEFVLKIADGWDLDDPFTEESLLQLEDENPGALTAIAAVYRASVAEARTKN